MKTKKELEQDIIQQQQTINDLINRINVLIDANNTLKGIVHKQEKDAMTVEDNTKTEMFNEQYRKFVDVNGPFLQRFIVNEISKKLYMTTDYCSDTHFKLSLCYDNKDILDEPIFIPRK